MVYLLGVLSSILHSYTYSAVLKQISVNKYLNSKLNYFPQTLFLLQPHDNINNNEFIITTLVLDRVFLVARYKDACCFNNLLLLLLYGECIERLYLHSGLLWSFCILWTNAKIINQTKVNMYPKTAHWECNKAIIYSRKTHYRESFHVNL